MSEQCDGSCDSQWCSTRISAKSKPRFFPCDLTADCIAVEHSKGCWRGEWVEQRIITVSDSSTTKENN